MKIAVFQKIALGDEVWALHLRRINFPLADILARDLAGMAIVARSSNGFGSPTAVWKISGGEVGLASFRVREGGAVRRVFGCILYKQIEALCQALAARYVPGRSLPIDGFIRRLSQLGRRGLAHRLQDLVSSGGVALRMHRGASEVPILPMISTEDLDRFSIEAPSSVVAPGGTYLCGKTGVLHGRPMLSVERRQFVSGRSIPVRDFALLGGSSAKGVLVYEGGVLRVGCPLEGTGAKGILAVLGREFASRLDRMGSARQLDSEEELLPSPERKAVVLIRVPKPATAPRAPRSIPPVLRRPLLIHDTRAPVPLPASLPVVEDKATAHAVLARTMSGVYVPHDVPAPSTPFDPDSVPWVVGVRVETAA